MLLYFSSLSFTIKPHKKSHSISLKLDIGIVNIIHPLNSLDSPLFLIASLSPII